jgi:hypothetical protein
MATRALVAGVLDPQLARDEELVAGQAARLQAATHGLFVLV